ncbi:MAG: ABC transporter permease [Candidatus Brennerbacteria bacterium]|nr:ABC transporter permease [Candidatus Brennerbacteria bacterium]
MLFSDTIQETYEALTANRVRTGLTVLGIVIGISSVIALVSVGQGAQHAIESNIQSIGSNLLTVFPGMQSAPGNQVRQSVGSARSLTSEDADAIADGVAGVAAVAPELSGRYQIVARGTNVNTQVVGTVPDYPLVRNMTVAEGSFITETHLRGVAKVVALGASARDDLFGEGASAVGNTVRVNGMQFTVVGVMEAKGGGGFGSQDDMVFVPLSSAQKFLAGDDYLSTLSVQAERAEAMTAVQADITDLLLARHRIVDPDEADFRVLSQSDLIASASSITDTLTMLLGAIAGISLLVGGIGIMNMMLTTVTERTREIGLRKAIGARNRDISAQFLIESVALTCAGGVIGIALGWLAAYAFSFFDLIQTEVSLISVLLAFGVAAAIGIVFGYYPARRAAGLNPIEALRYE